MSEARLGRPAASRSWLGRFRAEQSAPVRSIAGDAPRKQQGPEMDIVRPFCQCACHWIDRSRGLRLTERLPAIDNIYPKHVGSNVNDCTEQRDHHDRSGFRQPWPC